MDADSNLISNHKNVSYNPHYNWKDITSEFFEFIKGKIIIIINTIY